MPKDEGEGKRGVTRKECKRLEDGGLHCARRIVEYRQKENVGRQGRDAQGGRRFSQIIQSHQR